ncbi:PREDICTED: probable calcium-binding protein CML45 [Nelumbo nucifera]|uniref:EF-hand domain-containing protein n=2 Tax=Nelumbo nucifera TaxID=4432 RepID=A0A822YQP1_NELNU|nr:PREDICTED: probable calcium-binding protein CML45 [Nelumbo nucifera]DAD34902.1 TPA_asm: hypothetical protein HUJ06_005542 [Nelumbo nucifera]
METLSPATILQFSLTVCVEYILCHRVLAWLIKLPQLDSSFQFPLRSLLDFISGKSKICSKIKYQSRESTPSQKSNAKGDDGRLCRRDVEEVINKLGLLYNPHGDKIQDGLSSDEVSKVFEDKEPSLEEVKDAFDVFDNNRDGFIDAKELQRVLCSLGFQEGYDVEQCKRMIKTFDVNRDGLIDFSEFLKLMESGFC